MSEINVKHSQLQNFKDPFNKDNIEAMHFHCMKNLFSGEPTYSGSVEFKNGDTKGQQNFKAESFPILIRKVEEFVESL